MIFSFFLCGFAECAEEDLRYFGDIWEYSGVGSLSLFTPWEVPGSSVLPGMPAGFLGNGKGCMVAYWIRGHPCGWYCPVGVCSMQGGIFCLLFSLPPPHVVA